MSHLPLSCSNVIFPVLLLGVWRPYHDYHESFADHLFWARFGILFPRTNTQILERSCKMIITTSQFIVREAGYKDRFLQYILELPRLRIERNFFVNIHWKVKSKFLDLCRTLKLLKNWRWPWNYFIIIGYPSSLKIAGSFSYLVKITNSFTAYIFQNATRIIDVFNMKQGQKIISFWQ